jgi:hypothetical protein
MVKLGDLSGWKGQHPIHSDPRGFSATSLPATSGKGLARRIASRSIMRASLKGKRGDGGSTFRADVMRRHEELSPPVDKGRRLAR